MPNYWRQLWIPWILSILVQRSFITAQQNQQPSFEDFNKSFQNLLMQYHQRHSVPGFGRNNVDNFRYPLGFEHLHSLHAHPLVFPPHAGFSNSYPAGSNFGLPNGALPMAPISVGNQQLISMQPQRSNSGVIASQQQFIPLDSLQIQQQYSSEQQIPLQLRQLQQSFGNNKQNTTFSLLTPEPSLTSSRNFVLAPLIQQQHLQSFVSPSAVFSTSQLSPIQQQLQKQQKNANTVPLNGQQIPEEISAAALSRTTIAQTFSSQNVTTAPLAKSAIDYRLSIDEAKNITLKGKSTKSTTVQQPTTFAETTTMATSFSTGSTTTQSNATPTLAKGIDRLKLAEHLNKVDLANLLHAANFTTGDARVFLKLVEKVLEDEVSQRLMEMQKIKVNSSANSDVNSTSINDFKIDNKNTNDIIHLEASGVRDEDAVHRRIFSLVIPPIHHEDSNDSLAASDVFKFSPSHNESNEMIKSDNESMLEENHQLKTANTHLNYNAGTLDEIDVTTNSASMKASNELPNVQKQKLSLTELNRNSYGVRIATNDKDQIGFSNTPGQYQTSIALNVSNSGDKTEENTTPDYRTKEQAEFDRLLEQLAESYVPSVEGVNRRNAEQQQQNDLLFRGGNTPQENPSDNGLPFWQKLQNNEADSNTVVLKARFSSNSGRNHRLSSRHLPHTAFEHLFEDYRYRLSGQNGMNDVIKALRNAHIGFFERRVAQRYNSQNSA